MTSTLNWDEFRLVKAIADAHSLVGAAILPCFVGDQRPELRRVGDTEPDLDVDLWILTHADLRHSARVRAFMDFAGAELTKMRGLIEGDGLEPPIAAAS